MDFELVFLKKVENPLKPLAEATETGKLGNMTVKVTVANTKGKINLDIIQKIQFSYMYYYQTKLDCTQC